MEGLRRISRVWDWLVAFRAVGETEHLPTASEELDVSASALSRSIRLLEEDVGQPLFDRVGRSLVLNAAGKKLLVAVRASMTLVDEALLALGPGQFVGPVHVSVPGAFAPFFVLPASARLAERYPDLVVVVTSHPPAELRSLLLRGELDIALIDGGAETEDLEVERIFQIEHAVYCGERHPLRHAKSVTEEQLAKHRFVAPLPDEQGVTPDGWPSHLSRAVALRASQMQVGIDACRSGDYLAVLPTLVARGAGLHRIEGVELPPTDLLLLRRPSFESSGRAEVLADAIRETVSTANL
jgi:DNA-binding transcriptional LysR family regulator